jgi:dinuclear metal center YbgI/SA1388 family protein
MKISEIISCLERFAPPVLQESYDNSGLNAGNEDWECTGILISLDTTESVIREAFEKKCNLVLSHHPILFGSLKKITGKTSVEKALITAIKNDIAIYAIHTNLDNLIHGVNGKMADQLGLINRNVLEPRSSTLERLVVFVPTDHVETVRNAVFQAGGGHIGNYSECSFGTEGTGTFKAGEGTHPFTGEKGKRHLEKEIRLEIIFPSALAKSILNAMLKAHPYEEVAYDRISLVNTQPGVGSGLIGDLPEQKDERVFLSSLKQLFKVPVIRHSQLTGRPVRKVALCGGSGSFLISKALGAGADFFLTADIKYHDFFDGENKLVLADLGHFESEQYTVDLLYDILREKFPTFAIQKSTGNSNPVNYFL